MILSASITIYIVYSNLLVVLVGILSLLYSYVLLAVEAKKVLVLLSRLMIYTSFREKKINSK